MPTSASRLQGDAYMAIAGLNGESAEDQLKSAARFAIDVVR